MSSPSPLATAVRRLQRRFTAAVAGVKRHYQTGAGGRRIKCTSDPNLWLGAGALLMFITVMSLLAAEHARPDNWTFLKNGGLSAVGAPVGTKCDSSMRCEDGTSCLRGICQQDCKTSAWRRTDGGLCYCSSNADCFSHNCQDGRCMMEEMMGHSVREEEELALWHGMLAKEEARDVSRVDCGGGDCKLRPINLAIVVAFPLKSLADAETNIRSWGMSSFLPCREGWRNANRVDLVIAVAILGNQRHVIDQTINEALPAPARRCFNRILVIDLGLTPEEDTYDNAPPAMFHGALNSTVMQSRGYNYMFWMETDVYGVRPMWLEGLYNLAVSHQGAWMIGSMQQHNRRMYGPLDYYHINGNALHAFDSDAYRMLLRKARIEHPHVFDYAIQIWRTQQGPMHAHIAQQVMHRFQYTKYIQNHPADVCMRTLEDFLIRHPSTFMVHSKAISALIRCSDCCQMYNGGMWSPWKRESRRFSKQMQCLYFQPMPRSQKRLCNLQDMSDIVYAGAGG